MAVQAPPPHTPLSAAFFPDFFSRFRSLDQLHPGFPSSIPDDSQQLPPLFFKPPPSTGTMPQQQQQQQMSPFVYNGIGSLRDIEQQKQQEHQQGIQGSMNNAQKRAREVPCDDEEALVLNRATFYGEPPVLTTTGPSPVSTGLRLATTSCAAVTGGMEMNQRTPQQTSTSGRHHILDLNRHMQAHMDKHRADVQLLIESQAQRMKQALEESNQLHARALISAIEENVSKRLKAKEEELEKANRKSQELEERLKQLTVEAQLWRNLAKNNELMALNLRQSLEQVVAQVRDQKETHHLHHHNYISREEGCGESEVDDAESCQFFGSGGGGAGAAGGSFLAENRELKDRRNCKFCRGREACILLLPCRHLCLCRDCEGRVDHCPICGTNKNASVQVYMS